ncbi:hypothetical protein ACA910_017477 [Epithemia clementina (nom. ined.)]
MTTATTPNHHFCCNQEEYYHDQEDDDYDTDPQQQYQQQQQEQQHYLSSDQVRAMRSQIATAAASVIPFHCIICFDEFNTTTRTPMVLPCGHTYVCLPCTKRLKRCMECREPLFLPEPTNPHHHHPHHLHNNNVNTRGGRLLPATATASSGPASSSFASPGAVVPTTPTKSPMPTAGALKTPLPIPKNLVLIALMEATERTCREWEQSAATAAAEQQQQQQRTINPPRMKNDCSSPPRPKKHLQFLGGDEEHHHHHVPIADVSAISMAHDDDDDDDEVLLHAVPSPPPQFDSGQPVIKSHSPDAPDDEKDEDDDLDDYDDDEEEEIFDSDRLLAGLTSFVGPCGTYAVREDGLVVLPQDPRKTKSLKADLVKKSFSNSNNNNRSFSDEIKEDEPNNKHSSSSQRQSPLHTPPSLARSSRSWAMMVGTSHSNSLSIRRPRTNESYRPDPNNAAAFGMPTTTTTSAGALSILAATGTPNVALLDTTGDTKDVSNAESSAIGPDEDDQEQERNSSRHHSNRNEGDPPEHKEAGEGGITTTAPPPAVPSTLSTREPFLLEYGQKLQVVNFEDGVATLARQQGFILASHTQLVKVGQPLEESCRLEGILESVRQEQADIHKRLTDNVQVQEKLLRRIRRVNKQAPMHPVITELPAPPPPPEPAWSVDATESSPNTMMVHPTTPLNALIQPTLHNAPTSEPIPTRRHYYASATSGHGSGPGSNTHGGRSGSNHHEFPSCAPTIPDSPVSIDNADLDLTRGSMETANLSHGEQVALTYGCGTNLNFLASDFLRGTMGTSGAHAAAAEPGIFMHGLMTESLDEHEPRMRPSTTARLNSAAASAAAKRPQAVINRSNTGGQQHQSRHQHQQLNNSYSFSGTSSHYQHQQHQQHQYQHHAVNFRSGMSGHYGLSATGVGKKGYGRTITGSNSSGGDYYTTSTGTGLHNQQPSAAAAAASSRVMRMRAGDHRGLLGSSSSSRRSRPKFA